MIYNVIPMKYKEEELLAYAKSRVHFLSIQKGKRGILAFMFLAATVLPVLWFACVKDKFNFEDYGFLLEKHFVAGVFASLGIILWLLVGIVATLRMFEGFYGKEIESLRLLIQKLEKQPGDNRDLERTRNRR
jgi:hypothetical protein